MLNVVVPRNQFNELVNCTLRHLFQMFRYGKFVMGCFQAKKCQNFGVKAQPESPKHQHQTTFETLK
jgi:hypothetical protein